MEANYSKTFIFFGEALLNILIVVAIASVATNIFLWVRSRSLSPKTKFKFHFFDPTVLLLVIAFSFLGYTIGLLIGLSQSPVVEAAIPALLTFYGGFLTYLFAKESIKSEKIKIGITISVIAVSFFLIYGVEIGSLEKSRAMESAKKFELYYFEKQEEIKKKYRQ